MNVPKPNFVFVESLNYAIGRGPCAAPVAVVLHEITLPLSGMDDQACRPTCEARPHGSFHFANEGCEWRQYVDTANTAYGFGIGAANAEIPPTLPSGCPTGTADQKVIHIAINWRSLLSPRTCPTCNVTDGIPQCLCEFLAWVFQSNGITLNAANLVKSLGELKTLDIPTLIGCIQSVIDCYNDMIEPPPLGSLCPNLVDTTDTSLPLVVQDGRCLKRLVVPPGSCNNRPTRFAFTPSGYNTMQAVRPVYTNVSGSFIPVELNQLVLLSGSVVVQAPSCDYAIITIKNTSTVAVTVTASVDGVPGSVINILPTNGYMSALGGSVDLEWVEALSTYILH